MIVCEMFLLVLLAILLCTTAYTDYKSGLIRNKQLLVFAGLAISCDVLYYSMWGVGYLQAFLVNFGMQTIIALLLYLCHTWAAGDSKFLIVIGLCLPGRFLTFWDIGLYPGFIIVVMTFSCAFLYIIVDSIRLAFKQERLFVFLGEKYDWQKVLISYLFVVGSLALVTIAISSLMPWLLSLSRPMLMAINFSLILIIVQVRDAIKKRTLCVAVVGVWVIVIFLSIVLRRPISMQLSIQTCFRSLAIMFLLRFASQFNYQTIPTSSVHSGQVLSIATVFSFRPSRIKGLPTGVTEDLRSRLTEEEANSVRRWGNSANGKEFVVIVRKIPFAVFISIGTIFFLATEVSVTWL